MDKDQAKVYEIIANIIGKLFLVFLSGAILLAVTIKLIISPSWPIATIEGLMAGTVYLVFTHYFGGKAK